jgi:hypothetical protein
LVTRPASTAGRYFFVQKTASPRVGLYEDYTSGLPVAVPVYFP